MKKFILLIVIGLTASCGKEDPTAGGLKEAYREYYTHLVEGEYREAAERYLPLKESEKDYLIGQAKEISSRVKGSDIDLLIPEEDVLIRGRLGIIVLEKKSEKRMIPLFQRAIFHGGMWKFYPPSTKFTLQKIELELSKEEDDEMQRLLNWALDKDEPGGGINSEAAPLHDTP